MKRVQSLKLIDGMLRVLGEVESIDIDETIPSKRFVGRN